MTSRKTRAKKEMLGQFTIRLYRGNPADEAIFEALNPLQMGILRTTIVESLSMGIAGLRKKGWPFLTDVSVEKKAVNTEAQPNQSVPVTPKTPVDKEPVNQARTALQELMEDNVIG